MNEHGKVGKSKQLNLKDPETYALAAELAARHGDSLAGVVKSALREKLAREAAVSTRAERLAAMRRISAWYAALPEKDTRTADEILGYDEHGLPT